MKNLLYTIKANTPKEEIISQLNEHPEIKFVSLVGIDLAGNDTDEKIPVEKVLEVAQNVLRTGKFGDGKIFVYELSDAVRIRTGHRGAAAIMDIPGEKPE